MAEFGWAKPSQDATPAADILLAMEDAWRACKEHSPAPSFIVFHARRETVRVRWRGKRMAKKVIAWPAAWGKCPRWAKEQLPESRCD